MIRFCRFCRFCVPVALLATATPAFAQQWGGGGMAASSSHTATHDSRGGSPAVHNASGGTWDGRQPTWGGSPPVVCAERHVRGVLTIPYYLLPAAVAAPAPVPAPVIADTVFVAVPAGPYEMKVVTPSRAPRELTTMDVYRQQRFGKP